MQNRSNKALVTDFYKQVIGQRDLSQVDTFISDNYIQHSPMGKDGKAGIVEMLQFLKTLPKPEHVTSPVTIVIADGDFVAIQLDINFMGSRKLVVDLFRVEDGKLAEHWDAIQDVAADVINDLSTVIIDASADAAANKAFIETFYEDVFVNNRYQNASKYFTPNSTNRQALHLKFKGRLFEALTNGEMAFELKVHRIIGEGSIVLVQSSYHDADANFVLYDFCEMSNGKLVAYWSIEQVVPGKMMHSNEMI